MERSNEAILERIDHSVAISHYLVVIHFQVAKHAARRDPDVSVVYEVLRVRIVSVRNRIELTASIGECCIEFARLTAERRIADQRHRTC